MKFHVMKLLRLYFRMLRYRVAIMLLVFFLLGVAAHRKITIFSFDYLWAAIALASSYVTATTINDITDRKIDSVNHPTSKGRPLITGEATEKDLYNEQRSFAYHTRSFGFAGIRSAYTDANSICCCHHGNFSAKLSGVGAKAKIHRYRLPEVSLQKAQSPPEILINYIKNL